MHPYFHTQNHKSQLPPEDLGNRKINLGNAQKCRAWPDGKILALENNASSRFSGNEAEPLAGAQREPLLLPPVHPVSTLSMNLGPPEMLALRTASPPSQSVPVPRSCSNANTQQTLSAQAHLLPGAPCLERHLPVCFMGLWGVLSGQQWQAHAPKTPLGQVWEIDKPPKTLLGFGMFPSCKRRLENGCFSFIYFIWEIVLETLICSLSTLLPEFRSQPNNTGWQITYLGVGVGVLSISFHLKTNSCNAMSEGFALRLLIKPSLQPLINV